MKLELKGRRLILRLPKFSDAPILEKYINDYSVSRWLTHVPYPYPKGDFKKWIKKSLKELKNKEGINFIITLNEEPIGSIGFCKLDLKNKRAEVGYWLAKKYWGQGIMTEAVKMALGFGFNRLKLHRIEAGHFKANNRSKRVQEKCGLKFEGIEREHIFKKGNFFDDVRRAILVNEYKKLEKKWEIER